MDLKVQGEVLRETHARMTEERNTGGSGGDREKLAWKIKEGRWWRWGAEKWDTMEKKKQKWRAKRAQSVSDKETFSSKVTDSSKCVLHWNGTAQPISGGKITGLNPPAARSSTESPVAFYQFGRIRNYFPELKTDAFLHISYHKCIQLRYNIL